MKLSDLLKSIAEGVTIDLSALTADQATALRTEAFDAFSDAKKAGDLDAARTAGQVMQAAQARVTAIADIARTDAEFDALAETLATPAPEAVADVAPVAEPVAAAAIPETGAVTAAGKTTGTATSKPVKAPFAIMAARGSAESFDPNGAETADMADLARQVKSSVARPGARSIPLGRIANAMIPQGRSEKRVGNHTAEVNTAIMDSYEDTYEHLGLSAAALTCQPGTHDRTVDICAGGVTSFYDALPKVPADNCKWSYNPDLSADYSPSGAGCTDLGTVVNGVITTVPPAASLPAGVTEWDATNPPAGCANVLKLACASTPVEQQLDKVVFGVEYSESLEKCSPEFLTQLLKLTMQQWETYRDQRLLWEFDTYANASSNWFSIAATGNNVQSFLESLLTYLEQSGQWTNGTSGADYKVAVPKLLLARFGLNEMGVGTRAYNAKMADLDALVKDLGFSGITTVGTDALQETAPLYPTLVGGTCATPVALGAQGVKTFPIRLIPSRYRLATTDMVQWDLDVDARCQKSTSITHTYLRSFNRGCFSPVRIDATLCLNSAQIGEVAPRSC
jgi:hypothetical protein